MSSTSLRAELCPTTCSHVFQNCDKFSSAILTIQGWPLNSISEATPCYFHAAFFLGSPNDRPFFQNLSHDFQKCEGLRSNIRGAANCTRSLVVANTGQENNAFHIAFAWPKPLKMGQRMFSKNCDCLSLHPYPNISRYRERQGRNYSARTQCAYRMGERSSRDFF